MKLTRKTLRGIILKELKLGSLGKNFVFNAPPEPPSIPIPKNGGGGESCDDYGDKYSKSYYKVMDAFNIAYPYVDGNHRVFLSYLTKSGIQLPFTTSSTSKELIDYVTDDVLDSIALDVCNMNIPGDEKYLVNLLKSPFTLLDGVEYTDLVNGKKVIKNTGTYLPNAFLKNT